MSLDPINAPVDFIRLAGLKSPGIAEIENAESLRDFVVRQAPFMTGARVIFRRRELAKFAIKFSLYTPEHHAVWTAWRALVDALPDVRREAKSLDIWHPLLEDLDIKSVVVLSVGQGVQTDDGVWTYTVKFLETRGLPKISLAKVEGSQAKAVDPIDKLIENLAGQVQELANE